MQVRVWSRVGKQLRKAAKHMLPALRSAALVLVLLHGTVVPTADAQTPPATYPTRTVRLVVPFPLGGPLDIASGEIAPSRRRAPRSTESTHCAERGEER
jgi:hypothetical protein